MQLFTNATETRFFLTENHVKNLHTIEIDSVTDALSKGVCELPLMLMYQYFKVDDLDELIVSNHERDDGSDANEPNTFHFDFLKWRSYSEIVEEGLKAGTFNDQNKRLNFLEAVCECDPYTNENKDKFRQFKTPDFSPLFIFVDYNTETIMIRKNADGSEDNYDDE